MTVDLNFIHFISILSNKLFACFGCLAEDCELAKLADDGNQVVYDDLVHARTANIAFLHEIDKLFCVDRVADIQSLPAQERSEGNGIFDIRHTTLSKSGQIVVNTLAVDNLPTMPGAKKAVTCCMRNLAVAVRQLVQYLSL